MLGSNSSTYRRRALGCLGILLIAVLQLAAVNSRSLAGAVTEPKQAELNDDAAAEADKDAKPESESEAKPQPETRPVELPPEQRPYRMQVSVAFEGHPLLSAAFRKSVIEEIPIIAARVFGKMWSLTVVEDPALHPASPIGLDRVTAEALNEQFGPQDFDKVYLLTIQLDGGRYEISGRGWDQKSAALGSIQSTRTYERRELADTAFALLTNLFEPLIIIESAEEDSARVRLRAGEFPAPDPAAAQIAEGDLFHPFLRFFNRDRELQGIQDIPWTYLTVENVDRSRATCSVATGLRSPLSRGASRRVESMALRLRPKTDSTQMALMSRSTPPRPLVGYQVDVYGERPSMMVRDDSTPPPQPERLLTNRWGVVDVLANADNPLVWLYVKSGSVLLGRVPFVPGVEDRATFDLPEDGLRLSVEGDVALLQGDLVDVIARRAVLTSLARNFAKEKKWDEVDEQTKRIAELPNRDAFISRLTAIRVPAVEAARARRSRTTEGRIQKLCDQANELINVYLDPDKDRAVDEELAELRQLEK